ncbi:MAG: hypothetical protein ACTSRU_13005 [Candidatus Hodarchaeales archaeon]
MPEEEYIVEYIEKYCCCLSRIATIIDIEEEERSKNPNHLGIEEATSTVCPICGSQWTRKKLKNDDCWWKFTMSTETI